MHRPLAEPIAAAALFRIEVDVILVVAVGVGTEHSREPRAGRITQLPAHLHRDIAVGQRQDRSVLELQRAEVDRIP
ncbi:MAG TPA: hypothetical protein VHG27_01325 [Xanthobacteraceae bacterium]|nr:hypothetical protein [Xanthobacteraceae bacterium]